MKKSGYALFGIPVVFSDAVKDREFAFMDKDGHIIGGFLEYHRMAEIERDLDAERKKGEM